MKLTFVPRVNPSYLLFILGSICVSVALTQEFVGKEDEGIVVNEVSNQMEGVVDIDAGGRQGKFLTWPQFPRFGNVLLTGNFNSRCVKDSGDKVDERYGICMPRSKCEKMGAMDLNHSCDKFGLGCCLFNATCDHNKDTITVRRDNVYITHKRNERECLTDYKFPRQTNVCQLRLEFKTFNLSPPNISGNCVNDKMTIRKADNLRDNLVICGRANETDHLYLHYGESNEIVINLDIAQQPNTGEVEVLVQQIKCNSADLAPEGCTQYFTQQRGDVRTFNFDRVTGQQLNNQVYAVCVKGSEGANSVTWNPCNGSEDFDIITPTTANGCPTDSVTIPGSLTTKFCTRGSLIEVTTEAKPYVMYVNFNSIEQIPPPPVPPGHTPGLCPGEVPPDANGNCIVVPDPNNPADILNRGFCLRYQRA